MNAELKSQGTSRTVKTNVVTVNNLAAAMNWTPPIYSIELSNKVIKARVVSGNFKGEGEGVTKNLAKQSAAKDFIFNVLGSEVVKSFNEEKSHEVDPVSALKEYCEKEKVRQPEYVAKCSDKIQSDNIMICKHEAFETVGKGSSLKAAKKAAAAKMMALISGTNSPNSSRDESEDCAVKRKIGENFHHEKRIYKKEQKEENSETVGSS